MKSLSSFEPQFKNHYTYEKTCIARRELVYRFQGKETDPVCALGRLCLDANVNPRKFYLNRTSLVNHETMQTIANYYGIEIDMIEIDHRLFKNY